MDELVKQIDFITRKILAPAEPEHETGSERQQAVAPSVLSTGMFGEEQLSTESKISA